MSAKGARKNLGTLVECTENLDDCSSSLLHQTNKISNKGNEAKKAFTTSKKSSLHSGDSVAISKDGNNLIPSNPDKNAIIHSSSCEIEVKDKGRNVKIEV